MHPIAAVQSEYSLWTRNPELGLIQACAEAGAILAAFSPVGRGYFGGLLQEVETFDERDFRHANPRFQGLDWRRNRDRLPPFLALAGSWGVKPATLAVAWTLAKAPNVVPIPGTRSAEHLDECAAAADFALDADRLAQLERVLPVGFAAGSATPTSNGSASRSTGFRGGKVQRRDTALSGAGLNSERMPPRSPRGGGPLVSIDK